MGDPGCSREGSFGLNFKFHKVFQTQTFEILPSKVFVYSHRYQLPGWMGKDDHHLVSMSQDRATKHCEIIWFYKSHYSLASSSILLYCIFIKTSIYVNILNTPQLQEAKPP